MGSWLRPGSHVRLVVLLCGPSGTELMKMPCELQIRGWQWWRMEKAVAPTPVLSPGKSHGRRGLVGCRPSGRYESDMTEQLHFHFSLSHIGEGNGNPLQCSCLETPMDGGAWWAAIYGVAQSRTQLKRLSSSSGRGEVHSNHRESSSQVSGKANGLAGGKHSWCC